MQIIREDKRKNFGKRRYSSQEKKNVVFLRRALKELRENNVFKKREFFLCDEEFKKTYEMLEQERKKLGIKIEMPDIVEFAFENEIKKWKFLDHRKVEDSIRKLRG